MGRRRLASSALFSNEALQIVPATMQRGIPKFGMPCKRENFGAVDLARLLLEFLDVRVVAGVKLQDEVGNLTGDVAVGLRRIRVYHLADGRCLLLE